MLHGKGQKSIWGRGGVWDKCEGWARARAAGCRNPVRAGDVVVPVPCMGCSPNCFAALDASPLCLCPSSQKPGGNMSSLIRKRKGGVGDLILCLWIHRF